jgi:hypothetical protein
MIVGNVSAMNLSIINTRSKQEEEKWARYEKSLRNEPGFDKKTLFGLSQWYWKELSNERRKEIQDNLKFQDEDCQAYFRLISLDLPEIQKKVLGYNFDEDQEAVEMFCSRPLMQAIEDDNFSSELYEKLKTNKNVKDSFTKNIIFKNIKNFRILNQNLKKDKQGIDFDPSYFSDANKEKLIFINEVLSQCFKIDSVVCTGSCRESLNIENFKEHFNISQLSFLPTFLAPFVINILYHCETISNDDYKNLVDVICPASWVFPGSFWFFKSIKINDGWVRVLMLSIGAIVPGFVVYSISVGLIQFLFKRCLLMAENSIVTGSCMLGIYLFGVVFYNIKQMLSLRKGQIQVKDLETLLKRTDIIIQ